MLKDLRLIWTEDQYQILGPGDEEGSFYFGRHKADDRYQVFLRSARGVKRKHIQTLSLESDEDLFWCCDNLEITAQPKRVLEIGRSENILRGYAYDGHAKKAFRNLDGEVKIIEQVLETGAQVVWLIPENPVGWILSLHGGPESHEGLEIRYGGLYRSLIAKGKAIAILNYRGSSQLAKEVSESVWGSWKAAIDADFLSLISNAPSVGLDSMPTSVFGVSFGGALALSLQKEYSLERAVLSSPLLDLAHQKNRGGADFEVWFDSRFSAKDFVDFSYANLSANATGEVWVCYSKEDLVLGSKIFVDLESDKKDSMNWNLLPDGAGHSPETYFDSRQRFERLYLALSLP